MPQTSCARSWGAFRFRVRNLAKVRLALWVTPRFLYLAGAIAVLLASSPGLSLLEPIGLLCAALLVVATVADAIIGPRRSALTLERVPTGHFALRVPGTIVYTLATKVRMCRMIYVPGRLMQRHSLSPLRYALSLMIPLTSGQCGATTGGCA